MRLSIILTILALYIVTSDASIVPSTDRHATQSEAECLADPRLICVIKGTEGYTVEGTVTFKPTWMKDDVGVYHCNVRIRAAITGLAPGKHGFHIHTYGDISVTDGSSTGGHFTNPWGGELPHGLPNSDIQHWGDLGNIGSNDEKMATYSYLNRVITLRGIVGRGMTIHEGKDKGPGFQPSGDAGGRVANCVIGLANPDA